MHNFQSVTTKFLVQHTWCKCERECHHGLTIKLSFVQISLQYCFRELRFFLGGGGGVCLGALLQSFSRGFVISHLRYVSHPFLHQKVCQQSSWTIAKNGLRVQLKRLTLKNNLNESWQTILQRESCYVSCRECIFSRGNVNLSEEYAYVYKVSKLCHFCSLSFFFSKESRSTMMDRRFSFTKFSFSRPPKNIALAMKFTACPRDPVAFHLRMLSALLCTGKTKATCHSCLGTDVARSTIAMSTSTSAGNPCFLPEKLLCRHFSRYLSLRLFSLLCWSPKGKN